MGITVASWLHVVYRKGINLSLLRYWLLYRIMARNSNTNFAAGCKREMRFHADAASVVKPDHLRDWVLLISRH